MKCTYANDVEMSVRLAGSLKRMGIDTLESLARLSPQEFLRVKNVGRKTLREAREILGEHGLDFYGIADESLCAITDRECYVLVEVFGLWGPGHPKKSLSEVGEQMCVTSERVRQITSKVVRAIRIHANAYRVTLVAAHREVAG